ncbi:hypothetical protein PY793_12720 [Acetobacter fabarum]
MRVPAGLTPFAGQPDVRSLKTNDGTRTGAQASGLASAFNAIRKELM